MPRGKHQGCFVFPTHVGMNRGSACAVRVYWCVPHACGDEPATKAREGRATYEEVSGGTFTITNLGAYGIGVFTPIITPSQVGILGVGRVVEKPVVYEGEIAKRSMMFLSLTFDHWGIDGAPAAAFLHTLKGHLEDPGGWWRLFPEGQSLRPF